MCVCVLRHASGCHTLSNTVGLLFCNEVVDAKQDLQDLFPLAKLSTHGLCIGGVGSVQASVAVKICSSSNLVQEKRKTMY